MTSAQIKADWIAVDWGTTKLRAFAMGPEGVRATAQSAEGMGSLAREEFEPALIGLIEPWLGPDVTPVLACGMVGSRQGWHEAPYRSVPCAPLEPGQMVSVPVRDARITVQIAPGLKQVSPADVMRGEETQLAGALTLHPGFDGAICLPGTHSKWGRISTGEVVGFQTYLTGEMFALLSEQSVLRHGMAEDWDDSAFDQGVAEGMARPERLMAQLFRLRAEGLIAGLTGGAARARLSGLLIGAELAATKGWWLGLPVLLVGTEGLARLYARALVPQGVTATVLPATECTIAGLSSGAGRLSRATE
ncbi:MAG: 2-dehydro-3-deoxygalactonokinase [Proteobacteria bacterium]|nr:2-dehydro-3-deoxygalactonokinase [Pseudomonadota bacterium]MDA1154763.1 2-dehydro-3-deoxygalactonokinase [Pseudomonadota bacterium]